MKKSVCPLEAPRKHEEKYGICDVLQNFLINRETVPAISYCDTLKITTPRRLMGGKSVINRVRPS